MEFGKLYFRAKRLRKNILISKIYKLISRCCFTCDIPLEADIDDTVYFCHSAFGTVINPNAKIGGCIIQHCVTIGELSAKDHLAPTIGNKVFIGAHAMVLGDITIGDGAKIGAGALVLCDVPNGCTAVGVPARVIRPM